VVGADEMFGGFGAAAKGVSPFSEVARDKVAWSGWEAQKPATFEKRSLFGDVGKKEEKKKPEKKEEKGKEEEKKGEKKDEGDEEEEDDEEGEEEGEEDNGEESNDEEEESKKEIAGPNSVDMRERPPSRPCN
jgi:hypothetical protein